MTIILHILPLDLFHPPLPPCTGLSTDRHITSPVSFITSRDIYANSGRQRFITIRLARHRDRGARTTSREDLMELVNGSIKIQVYSVVIQAQVYNRHRTPRNTSSQQDSQ